jgi:hypothetical protein
MVCVQCFGRGKLRERDHLKDLGINGMILLKVNWIDLVQGRNKWQDLLNRVI